MELLTIIGIALSLAMDAFSVCVVAGAQIGRPTLRHYFRLSFHFGLFQFFMPVLGYYGGVFIESAIHSYDHWIALSILSFIGLKMLWESFKDKESDAPANDPSRGATLLMLSIATSIDAAAIGFSFAALRIPILKPAWIIGVVCAACSAAGLLLGSTIGPRIGAWAERLGGAVLISIGIKILIEHVS
ncbi:MAG: manganese efflux pump [Spirochaetes bacterium]|nr:manganese efflux pump [Spirochaetota bacterium]